MRLPRPRYKCRGLSPTRAATPRKFDAAIGALLSLACPPMRAVYLDARVADVAQPVAHVLLQGTGVEEARERRRRALSEAASQSGSFSAGRRRATSERRSPSNGRGPVSISNSNTPNAQRLPACPLGSPRPCSGRMYAAVPRTIPAAVAASSVGDQPPIRLRLQSLRETEVQHLHRAVRLHVHIRRLQVAVNDARLVRGFEPVRDLRGDASVIERQGGRADAGGRGLRPVQLHREAAECPRTRSRP